MTAYSLYYIVGSTNVNIITYIIDFTLERELEKLLDCLKFTVSRQIDNLSGFIGFDPHVEILLQFNGIGIFRGRIKTNNKKNFYECEAYSSAEILNRTIAQQVFTDTTPEEIFTNLINNYTDLTPITQASGTTIKRFLADDYISSIFSKLTEALGWLIYTDSNKNIYFEPRGNDVSGTTISRSSSSSNAIFQEWKKEHNEMCNDIRVTGDNINYSTIDIFAGDGSTTIFTLTEAPNTIKILLDSVEQSPNDYSVEKDIKKVTFNTAPALNVVINADYSYAYPIFASRESLVSIATYGRFTKGITNKWLKTRQDTVAYCNNYLEKYKEPLMYNDIVMNAYYITTFMQGEQVHIIDDIESINDYFVINKIKLKYLTGRVEINIGDYLVEFIGIQRVLQGRITELEKSEMKLVIALNSNSNETLAPTETLTESSINSINFKLVTNQVRCDYGRGTLYDARADLCQS